MNTKISTALVPLLLLPFALIAQQTEKTLVKSFNLHGNQSVYIDVDARVDVKEWNQDEMRIIMTVSLDNGSELMLKSLVTVGRYNLKSIEDGNDLKIFAPGLERRVKLRNGGELIETISFEIFAPHNVLVKARNDDSITEKS